MSEPPAGRAVSGPPAERPLPGQRFRTHPLTPVVASVRSLGVVAAVLVVMGTDVLGDLARRFGALLAVVAAIGLALVVLVVSAGLNYIAWLRTEFYFDEAGDFRVDSGVLQRQERRLALSRLQSVDIVRPLLGRVVGLSQVRIEVAGGGDSRVIVSYLADQQAHSLRAEIIARAAGIDPGAGEAPERVLATVPTTDLILSLLMRSETIILALVSVAIVASTVIAEGAAGLLTLLLLGGLPLIGVFSQFSRFFGFTVADSPDGLRLRHGLVSAQSQTVPPGRIQAIEVSQPLLWRRRGWVRVTLNVAGIQADEEEHVEHMLLPVAPREAADAIIARVLPGVVVPDLQFEPAPRAARARAWLQWSTLGVAADARVLATRRGFLTRRVAVIPHARTQSVRVTQGPWQRRLGLASVHVDTTPGPVSVVGLHRAAADARAIAEDQLQRGAAARAAGPPERWLTRRPSAPMPPPPGLSPDPAESP